MAIFQPHRLVQARQIRRTTARELAEVASLSPKAISAYETGRNSPLSSTLEFIARYLQFPAGFFYRVLDNKPTDVNAVFFRSLRSSAADDRARMVTLGDIFQELMVRIGENIPLKPSDVPRADQIDRTWDLSSTSKARNPDLIEDIATQVRRAWGLGDGPLPDVVRLLEAHGIWVHVLPKEAADIDAFSYWNDGRAHIVLNHAKGDPYRSRFDAAHELGHLVMHDGNVPDSKEREREANLFASAFLLPRATWLQVAPRTTNPWHYVPLKKQWRVSVACTLYRSKTLELLDERRFTSAMVQYSQLGWRSSGEPLVEGATYEHPILFNLCINTLGRGVIRRMVDEMLLPGDVAQALFYTSPDPTASPPHERGSHLRVVK